MKRKNKFITIKVLLYGSDEEMGKIVASIKTVAPKHRIGISIYDKDGDEISADKLTRDNEQA